MLALDLLAAGCRSPGPARAAPPTVVQPPVAGLVATLEDEVRDLPGDRIAWATHWQLCWEPYPTATAYELQSLTGEGASSRLRRQDEPCFRLQVASGENQRSEGLANRELLLALQAGQLGYRVRAVLPGNRVSAWSQGSAVGETSPSAEPSGRAVPNNPTLPGSA